MFGRDDEEGGFPGEVGIVSSAFASLLCSASTSLMLSEVPSRLRTSGVGCSSVTLGQRSGGGASVKGEIGDGGAGLVSVLIASDFSAGILMEDGCLLVVGSGALWVFDICSFGASDVFRCRSSVFSESETLLAFGRPSMSLVSSVLKVDDAALADEVEDRRSNLARKRVSFESPISAVENSPCSCQRMQDDAELDSVELTLRRAGKPSCSIVLP
jgi:hypothetical protein